MYNTCFIWDKKDIYMKEHVFNTFVNIRKLPVFEADGFEYTLYEGFIINKI